MVTGLPGLPGHPAQGLVMKAYRNDCVIAQIQLQQMMENLVKGNPWKPKDVH